MAFRGRASSSFRADATRNEVLCADQQIPAVGESLLKEIMAEVERLADFPESGRLVPEFGIADLREIIHAPFRIVCRLGRSRVRIVRAWRGERLLEMPCLQ